MNKYQEALEELTNRADQIKHTLDNNFLIAVAEQEISLAHNTLQELVDKEIELESRKDKLFVGSEWECLVDCLCSVDDNKKQRKVGLIKKGSKFKIHEFIEVLERVTIKEPLKFDIPVDQFLLCFKPKGEK